LRRRRGAVGRRRGALVALLWSEADVEAFFREYPDSIVLVHESAFDVMFGSDRTEWRARVRREFVAGRNRYVAIGGS